MDKKSKINSQISTKIYDATLDDIDPLDNDYTSDLYMVEVFGKNIIIAPGKSKKDKSIPGLTYFYIYAIKNDLVLAKLGIYEKITTESIELYDLTTFPDGSLILFDIYYTNPDLLDVFQDTENKKENTSEEINVSIDNKDYVMKGRNIYDMSGKIVGTTDNQTTINWKSEKTNNNSPPYIVPSKIIIKNSKPLLFDYLKKYMLSIPKINKVEQSKKVLAINTMLKENDNIDIGIKKTYLKLLTFVYSKNYIFDTTFFDNLTEILNTYDDYTLVNKEKTTIFILYILEQFINLKFEFINKSGNTINTNVRDIGLKFPSLNSKKTISVQIINDVAYTTETISGTSLNNMTLKKSSKLPVGIDLNEESKLVESEEEDEEESGEEDLDNKGANKKVGISLNEESVNENSNEGSSNSNEESSNNSNQKSEEESPDEVSNNSNNSSSNEEPPPPKSKGKIKLGGNNAIKLK